jgi:hypothetical protein
MLKHEYSGHFDNLEEMCVYTVEQLVWAMKTLCG